MSTNSTVSVMHLPGVIAVASCLGLLAATAHADPLGGAEMPIATLKNVYLECERAALGGRLETGEIEHCSVVYEELKRRAFNGEFRRLKAWSDAALAEAASGW